MDFNDFCREFEVATICTMGNDFGGMPDNENAVFGTSNHKAVKLIYGNWKYGLNAGGTMANFEKFATNPQYMLLCHRPKNSSDAHKVYQECTVVVSLMQETKDAGIVDVLDIGFAMFKV
ncbi:unnamed protein product, partial [Notodromas monacha]